MSDSICLVTTNHVKQILEWSIGLESDFGVANFQAVFIIKCYETYGQVKRQ